MTLDSFLEMDGLPNAGHMMELCESLDIKINTSPPTLNFPKGMEIEALAIAKILRREPWRTQVIESKGKAEPQKLPPPPDEKSTIKCGCGQFVNVFRICEACRIRLCLCGVRTPSTFDEWCSICVHRKR